MSKHQHSTDEVVEVDTGSFTISYRVQVNAEPKQLWQLAVNPYRHHELDGGDTLSPKVAGPAELSAGDTFNIWMRQFGVPYTLTMRVVDFEPGRTIGWRHPAGHIWRWSFEPAPSGGTWVTETFDYRQVKPWMLRLWKLARIFSRNATNIQATLEQLQDRFAQESHV